MPHIFDWIALLLVIVMAVCGYRRGLVGSVGRLGRPIAAVFLTATLSPILSNRFGASVPVTVGIFLAMYALLTVALRLLSRLVHLSPLAGLDRIGGLAAGLLLSTVAVWLCGGVIAAVSTAVGHSEWLGDSVILRALGS